MEFLIKRTSNWNNEKPIEEAAFRKYVFIDERHVDDPKKIPAFYGNKDKAELDWFSSGINHRVVNGHIRRDFIKEDWFIDISTLEELIVLHEKVGCELVVGKSWRNDELYEIEIYDDYRE